MGLHERKLRNTRAVRASNTSRYLESDQYEEGTEETDASNVVSESKAMRAPLKTAPSTTNVRKSAGLQLPNSIPAENITETIHLHRGSLLQNDTTPADRVIHRSHSDATTSSLEAPKESREAAKPSNLAFIPERLVANTAPQSMWQPKEEPRSTSLNKSPVVKNGSHTTCREELSTPSSDEDGAGVIGKLPAIGFAPGSRSNQRRKRHLYLFYNETQTKMRDLERQLQVLETVIQLQFQELSRAFGELQAQLAKGDVVVHKMDGQRGDSNTVDKVPSFHFPGPDHIEQMLKLRMTRLP